MVVVEKQSLILDLLAGKAVVLVMESWASEMAFRIRFLLACLPGGREGLEGHQCTFRFRAHIV